MPNIDWYGPEEGGKTATSWKVSHTTPVVDALKHHAKRIAYKAAFLLDSRAQHRTGDAHIRTVHYPQTDLDSYVYLVDPENKRAALSIENGHNVVNHEGEVVGHEPGLNVLKDSVH